MPDCLHPLLLALTLLNLGFVQATGVVSFEGLLPLWLLTAGAPWLRSLQRFITYRIGWNLGVLLVFAVLVGHATTTGLLFMLEDGLLLAVLCQVHLLNNVGARQRPDLIFFNSFLIAFVTSFFAPDLWWSLLFVLHTIVLVPALQVNVLVRAAGDVPRAVVRAVLRDSMPRTAAICLCTASVFVLWPRNFHRAGWLDDALALRRSFGNGGSEQIRIDDERATPLSDEIALRIEPVSGRSSDVPSHWRGLAFTSFTGTAWMPQDVRDLGSRFATDPAWKAGPDNHWHRASATADAATHTLRVRQLDVAQRRLFNPLAATELWLDVPGGVLLDPKSYGGFAFLHSGPSLQTPLAYMLRVAPAPSRMMVARQIRDLFLQLPDSGVSRVATDLARQLRSELPADCDPETIGRHSADWLQTHRRYQLPGGPGFARNLDEFLLGSGAAHCEYFATSLALLLRLQQVPCRLIGGYLAHEWDPETGAMLVRSRDAHAWVEALRADGTWLTLDATPASDLAHAAAGAPSWWQRTRQQLEQVWRAVVGFDADERSALLATLARLPQRLVGIVRQHALLAALSFGALVVLVCIRRRRRQSQPAIAAFLRATRAAGLQMLPGETPRELLARASCMPIPEMQRRTLAAAADHHESLRYANSHQVDP